MKRIELPNLNLSESPRHIIERLLSTRNAMIQRNKVMKELNRGECLSENQRRNLLLPLLG
jgi:hypothetical protein